MTVGPISRSEGTGHLVAGQIERVIGTVVKDPKASQAHEKKEEAP